METSFIGQLPAETGHILRRWVVLARSPTSYLLLGFVRTRVLISRSRLNNRATMEADILSITGSLTPEAASVAPCCSGSLEPESSYHDRDWIMEIPMEADILTFTGILTPEDASVASCLLRLWRSFCGCPQCGAAPYKDCFLDLRLFSSPDLGRLGLCYCCQAWTLETVLGGNTALTRWWTARSIDADEKR